MNYLLHFTVAAFLAIFFAYLMHSYLRPATSPFVFACLWFCLLIATLGMGTFRMLREQRLSLAEGPTSYAIFLFVMIAAILAVQQVRKRFDNAGLTES